MCVEELGTWLEDKKGFPRDSSERMTISTDWLQLVNILRIWEARLLNVREENWKYGEKTRTKSVVLGINSFSMYGQIKK